MFKRAKLINFRQHRDLEVFFSPGMNAIRGLNEKGKTTLLEALAYVMFGARLALRESIDQVVTYGEKLSSLKAETDMEINGVVYCGKRSKSGAEVWLAGGAEPLVVGQDECTKFWEALLGVSGKVASDLMLANQTSIRGALAGGSNAPVLLIEKLANFRVIDTILNLVMDEVPNGQTKRIEERIGELQQRLEESSDVAGQEEVARLEDVARLTLTTLQVTQQTKQDAQKACDTHRPKAEAAQRASNELNTLRTRHAEAKARLASASSMPVVPPAPDSARIVNLRKAVDDAERFGRAKTAVTLLNKLGQPEAEWDEGMPALLAGIAASESAAKEAAEKKSEWQQVVTRKTAMLIKEKSCAFCAKDLTDVPEVATHNSQLEREIEDAKGNVAEWQDRLAQAAGDASDLKAVVAQSNAFDRVYRQCSEFITLDEAFVPARWTWTGPDTERDIDDPRGELQRLEREQKAHDQAQGAVAQAVRALEAAQQTETRLAGELAAAEAHFAGIEGDIRRAEELATAYAAADAAFRQAQEAHQQARGAHETAAAILAERLAARKRLQADLEDTQADLVNTVKGNGLLGKLRDARPVIAGRLWTVVLSSVSTYFSSIRGKASIVTREAGGFMVDGQPVEGLSGSTLDALGLAIRVALVRTFLPNCGFMVLDEPAAACDDDRETNLLGLVASVGFDQVLLVTHSDLSDAFAQQVIQL